MIDTLGKMGLTFDHLNVIGYERDIILDLEARMSRSKENQIP